MIKRQSKGGQKSRPKRRKLSLVQVGVVISLVLAVCCFCSLGISLLSGGNSKPTQVMLAQSSTQTPTTLPTQSPEPSPTNTPIPPTEIIPLPVTPTLTPTTVDLSSTNTPQVENPLRVHFINVGQGDATLIQAPDGETMLIDGGDSNTGVLQYLLSQGVQHLNLMVATHPHSDHIGGLVQVLEGIPVDEVITNGQMHTTSIYERFLDAIASAQVQYAEVKRGDMIPLGNLEFDVLSPISITSEDLNDNSIVLRLVYGDTSFLFTGDAQANAEASMLNSDLDVSATILKVAHHGSRTSSTPAFLNAVKPQVAIYFAGLGNDYGHPHAETLEALSSVGAKIYGTDIDGTIIVITDGKDYTVEPEKQGQVQVPPTAIPTQEQETKPEIRVVSLTSPISAGGTASLTINTVPGAACTITVYYKSGPSQAQGLGPQTAGSSGNVAWSWKVGSRTTPGTWRIVVTANINGQTISIEIPFEVQ
jgi:competence protein ComEC